MQQRNATASPTGRLRNRQGRRMFSLRGQRVGVAVLLLLLGLLFALQITPAFRHGQAFGALTIVAACALVMFGMALLTQPWAHDDVGHDRHPADAERRSRQWYRAGAIGVALSLTILVLAQVGAIHVSSTPGIERLAIVLEFFAIIWLARLASRPLNDTSV